MPLPLIPIAIAMGASALFGAGKTAKAVINSKEADKLNDAASYIINNSKDSLELAKGVCSNNLKNLGFKKAYVLNDTVIKFIASFEKLKNINFQSSVGMDELNKFITDEAKFKEIKEMSILASSIIQGVGGGAVAGAAIAFGAYGAVGALGAASTGAAISTLSGAVATNATLAFLGGGTIAAGGLGVAGGMAVLGGMVAAPALLVIGLVSDSKASAKLDEAKANLAEAKTIAEGLKNMEIMAYALSRRAQMFNRLLMKLDSYLAPLVYEMENIIASKGEDFSKFDENEQEMIAKAVSMVKSVKTVLDTPIIDDNGGVTEESLLVAKNANTII
jgi:transmembrane protein